jgi:16S rRNA (guanine(527)-N(7))-methyltransferase RsmG
LTYLARVRTPALQQSLDLYKKLLLTWTAKMNLIGPEARENIDAHIAEAVTAARILKPQGNVLDFGSGGGLPGIPMALMSPDARFHLVEADQKKWAFLKHVVRECGLDAVVHGDRLARVLAKFPPDLKFSLVVSRAVGKPEEWVPLLAPFLADGARVGLFQATREVPPLGGFVVKAVHALPRGAENWLVELAFHVEH